MLNTSPDWIRMHQDDVSRIPENIFASTILIRSEVYHETHYLGIAKNQWTTMHNNTSLIFAALLIIHLLLHWKFFRHISKALNPKGKEECETTP
jgi:hypothetical protein